MSSAISRPANTFIIATRATVLPVMAIPVLIGGALAWEKTSLFHPLLFIGTLIGTLAAHLAANTVNDIFDFQSGADQAAASEDTSLPSGSTLLLSGRLPLTAYWRLTLALFAIALACGIILAIAHPWVIGLAIAGFLLAFFYVAPPIRYGYIGHSLGETGIFLSFGLLPLAGTYYVQTGIITGAALAASVPIGLFTTAILYFHHFLHWRADRAIGKMTPVAVLGADRAHLVGIALPVTVAVAIIVDGLTSIFPWYTIFATIPIVFPLRALLAADGTIPKYGALMAQALRGNILSGLIILIATIIGGAIR
jgi:1,4-dihydroxy-2-naphthoate octaprenyltransferase